MSRRPPLSVRRALPVASAPPQLVDTGDAAWEVAVTLRQYAVAWVGWDSEYRFDNAEAVQDTDPWSDIRSLRPLLVSIAPVIHVPDGGLETFAYVFDVRIPAVLAALQAIFNLAVRFVSHQAKSEMFTAWALSLVPPSDVYCTYLAARAAHQGRFHRRYYTQSTQGNDADSGHAKADAERAHETSLLGFAASLDVAIPAAGHDKGTLSKSFLTHGDTEPFTREQVEYAGDDAVSAALLYPRVREHIDELGLARHTDEFVMPAARVYAEIEWQGIPIDHADLPVARNAILQKLDALSNHLTAAGIENPNSHPQRYEAIKKLHLLAHFEYHTNKSGYTFERERLKEFRRLDPLIDFLYQHSNLSQFLRFLQGDNVGKDGNVHPDFCPIGADSGRPTTRKPNLLGIPRILRPLIMARKGYVVVDLDAVQQEIGIAAAEFGSLLAPSKPHPLLDAFNSGDVYVSLVRRVLTAELSPEDLALSDAELKHRHPAKREQMKVLLLAFMYGMGAKAVAGLVGCSRAKAQRLMDKLLVAFPELAVARDILPKMLAKRGFAETRTGMKRFRARDGELSNWERNWAVNLPVQGGAACLLMAMLPDVHAYLKLHGGRILLPVYDALVVELPADNADVLTDGVRERMLTAFSKVYPELRPRLEATDPRLKRWSKDNKFESVRCVARDPMFTLADCPKGVKSCFDCPRRPPPSSETEA